MGTLAPGLSRKDPPGVLASLSTPSPPSTTTTTHPPGHGANSDRPSGSVPSTSTRSSLRPPLPPSSSVQSEPPHLPFPFACILHVCLNWTEPWRGSSAPGFGSSGGWGQCAGELLRQVGCRNHDLHHARFCPCESIIIRAFSPVFPLTYS